MHTLFLRDDGSVSVLGSTYGEVTTLPPSLTNVIAISAGLAHDLALKRDGTIVAWGDLTNFSSRPYQRDRSCRRGYHNLALQRDGNVVAWGDFAVNGQTNVPPGLTNVVAIAASIYQSMALQADGGVISWGGYTASSTNVPLDVTNAVAIAATVPMKDVTQLALWADGRLSVWGYGPALAPVPVGLSNALAIAAGERQDLAIRADAILQTWNTSPTNAYIKLQRPSRPDKPGSRQRRRFSQPRISRNVSPFPGNSDPDRTIAAVRLLGCGPVLRAVGL